MRTLGVFDSQVSSAACAMFNDWSAVRKDDAKEKGLTVVHRKLYVRSFPVMTDAFRTPNRTGYIFPV